MDIREKLAELLNEAFEFHIDDPYCRPDANEFADRLIARGVTVQEWIPVTDRLPNHGDIVLCNTRYHYEVLQWDGRANRWVNNFMNPKKEYVTHWMPLPTPPKGE